MTDVIKILLNSGVKYNLPFKAIQEITLSLTDFFASLPSGELNSDLVHSIKNAFNSSDTFDRNLIQHFDTNFAEIVDIYNSEEFFGYLLIKR